MAKKAATVTKTETKPPATTAEQPPATPVAKPKATRAPKTPQASPPQADEVKEKKPPREYNQYVKDHYDEYRNLPHGERFAAIGAAWKKHKEEQTAAAAK